MRLSNETIFVLILTAASIFLYYQIQILRSREPVSGTGGRKTVFIDNKRVGVPAILFQDANYKGKSIAVFDNISDLQAARFRGVSSLRVSKGVTITLFSERGWKGRELFLDADVSFIGAEFNDRSYSLAVSEEPVEPRAVRLFR
eukprot:CAMPEP_0113708834 /NCGR_PEP_ID=MMETSP0038_2-20120614/29217_1 /TAXON_ID=2898 /ORGANISM="Cryptomonas paramecium" /LENGTH=143 /DNA_ID=CAMNT_0000634615 /DNA_START=46 /DNA_END=474 /DNA_ORIENTATION=- /assembly_acc=CAM_ASM_000170